MRTHKRGFTLIELLVVIAIIGILATLVITQLAGAQVRARNSTAKSDVAEMGKAVETWKTNNGIDNPVDGKAITSATVAGTSINVTTAAGGWGTLFPASGGYPVTITKTPGSNWTYSYVTDKTNATPSMATYTSAHYCVATNVSTSSAVVDTAFYITDGTSASGAGAAPTFTQTAGTAACP